MEKKVLIIGQVIPEPNSSAAGQRILTIISLFQKQGFQCTFATAAQEGEHPFDLGEMSVRLEKIKLNCSSFDTFLTDLSPTIVLYDRYMTEEQYGWRVREVCPLAIQILDTEDLHCLRDERWKNLKKNIPFQPSNLLENKIALREIASIYRCDLTLIISQIEIDILKNIFGVNDYLLYYLPLLIEEDGYDLMPYENREHFLSIGNFLHPPNWDAVQILKNEIWQKIRRQIPRAELHVYGAYSSDKAQQLHNEKEGFLIKGWTEDTQRVVANARVLLAPLRFGAGQKGKLLEAMRYGTPSVTTTVGAEGMQIEGDWNGYIEDDWIPFAERAVELYQNEKKWSEFQQRGIERIQQHFLRISFEEDFEKQITLLQENIGNHRRQNFVRKLLTHHSRQSTKYMSRWIEEKNK